MTNIHSTKFLYAYYWRVARMYSQPIPDKYYKLTEQEVDERIYKAKEELGNRLVILGHHYQRDEVIRFADYRGDSLKLSQLASSRPEVDYIVFCGVHFMAESADILSGDHQKVNLPDLNAGCHMADMADLDLVEECWEQLNDVVGDEIMPITYINCTADLKAFVGQHDGAVCTSSNAGAILEWGTTQKDRLLFFPDQHLGRNTGVKYGIDLDEMILWDPYEDLGGNTEEEIEKSKLILWKGCCPVHQLFTTKQIKRLREQIPDIQILVHPECRYEVVQESDLNGSTAFIIKTIEEAPAGSSWGIGTEMHLVTRLAQEHQDKFITSIDPNMCLCTTMNRIDAPHLLWSLENLLEDEVVNQISVPQDISYWAKASLDRMLDIT